MRRVCLMRAWGFAGGGLDDRIVGGAEGRMTEDGWQMAEDLRVRESDDRLRITACPANLAERSREGGLPAVGFAKAGWCCLRV